MKDIFFPLYFLFCFCSSFGQYQTKPPVFCFPNIEGYITLKGDFHTHTIFSDGQVWPEYRVLEAAYEGLDIIAITDHIEYTPNWKDIVLNDRNRAYEIAKAAGIIHGIIVIPGAEITRAMPPGHLTALFVNDVNSLRNAYLEQVINEATNQDAFIIWSHPCWEEQQPDTVKWWHAHTVLYNKGQLRGIEIHNFNTFCNEAWEWAIEKNLTIFANSDLHSTTQLSNFKDHRPITLVLSKGRDIEDVKRSIIDGKTLTYSNNTIRGNKYYIEKLFTESLVISKHMQKKRFKKNTYLSLNNVTSMPIVLHNNGNTQVSFLNDLIIPPKSNIVLHVNSRKNENKLLQFYVSNFLYKPNHPIDFVIDIDDSSIKRIIEPKRVKVIAKNQNRNRANNRNKFLSYTNVK